MPKWRTKFYFFRKSIYYFQNSYQNLILFAMSEITQLVHTLKLQGKTYRYVAESLGLSEASIKRLFTSERLTLDRLIQISHLLGFTLAELAQEASENTAKLQTLTIAQEKELVADTKLLLVAVCALNHWAFKDMISVYRFSEAECLKYLLKLDRLHLISLLPDNRIRLNVSRNFEWIQNGPIQQYFHKQGMLDFLSSSFLPADESLAFSHGMLTEAAIEKIQAELHQLRMKFAALHEESLSSPLAKRRGCGLLLAMREWEPAALGA